MEEGGGRVNVKVMLCQEDLSDIADFDHERRPQAKECRQPLEAGKDAKMDSPLESPGWNTAQPTP